MASKTKKFDNPTDRMAAIVIDAEYEVARQSDLKSRETVSYEALVDMLEGRRTEKDYEWMSDINIPEMASVLLTDMSGCANQLFQSREFVETVLDGELPFAKEKARAAKRALNNALNVKEIYHYQKYMRARTINSLVGNVWVLMYWDQETRQIKTGSRKIPFIAQRQEGENLRYDLGQRDEDVMSEQIVRDRFNYVVLDPRNVFTDNKYTYSAQQKRWVILRSETDLFQIESDSVTNQYENLDLVREALKNAKGTLTATEQESYGKEHQGSFHEGTPLKTFDIIDRYGKFWAIVKDRDEQGVPIEIGEGLDDEGNPLPKAELVETIITYALIGSQKIRLRFIPTPYVTSKGVPYRPLVRGVCYVSPDKDIGLSDGKNMRELQIAINDMFNLSADRAKLALLPKIIARKGSLDDGLNSYIEPEKPIEVDSLDDIREFQIDGNIRGGADMMGILSGKIHQVASVFPTTMGDLPGAASTTATAVAGAESRGNARANYKSLTFEYTFLQEFYSIILHMINRFAKDETLVALVGPDLVKYFTPDEDYTYVPISSNIETEHSKFKKLQVIDNFLGRVGAIPNPNTPKLLNYLLTMSFELFGKEFPDFQKFLLDESVPPPMDGGGQMPQPGQLQGTPMSNQNMVPQTGGEIDARAGGLLARTGVS